MAYTYDVSTSRGQVRLAIGDTSEAHAVFSDAEVDRFLSMGGSFDGGVNEALRTLITIHAHRGDAARVASLQAALRNRGGDLPTIVVGYPAELPMDVGYDEIIPLL